MKKNWFNFFLVFLVNYPLIASEHEGASSGVSSLLPSFVNFGVLLFVLIWKGLKPLKNYFAQYSHSVALAQKDGEIKSSDAKKLILENKEKLKNIKFEKEIIEKNFNEEASKFEIDLIAETDARIKKVKNETQWKLESEKRKILNKYGHVLVEDVLNRSRETFVSSERFKQKASKNILEKLQ